MSTDVSPAPTHRPGSLGELLAVAVPLVISYGSSALMYVVDRIFLSWDSVESLAASLPAGVVHYNLCALAIGTVSYANAFVGQYEGAEQHQRVGPVLWQAIYLALGASALIGLSVLAAPAMFTWFDHGETIRDLELRYYRIMALGTAPWLISTALSCFYSGRGKTTVIMVINLLATALNVTLDYLLIFGKAGFPDLGIEGAALATVISFAASAVMFIVVMAATERHGHYHLWTGRRFDRELIGRLLWFGLPSGLHQFLEIACFTVFIQLVGRLGTAQLSATSLVFNLNSLVFIPMLGLGTAVTVLVGHRVGEGQPQTAIRTTWLAAALASAYVAAFGALYLFAPYAILKPYGLAEQDGVRELVVFLLKLVAVYSFFDALSVVFSSAIRGAGDTLFAMLFSFSMGILVLVIPTFVASRFGEAGFNYAWYAVTAYVFVLGAGFIARFQQGKWMTMRVIEHTLPELEGDDLVSHEPGEATAAPPGPVPAPSPGGN
ncbi:MAG: MATE family efflux transporter [Planctomycetota bacterium]|nr:MAG: MATE family efflux transporter [Planctomycetota bacterium]